MILINSLKDFLYYKAHNIKNSQLNRTAYQLNWSPHEKQVLTKGISEKII